MSDHANTASGLTRRVLALGALPGVGPATLNAVLQHADFGAEDRRVLARLHPALGKALSNGEAIAQADERATAMIAAAAADGARVLSPVDPEYPPLLAATPDRPPILYVKGELGPTRERPLGVVGTREPTEHGRIIAHRIAYHFASRGWSIVSGLALGVDALAHRAALEAGGHTVAVLAHGLDTVAPKSHAPLAREILDRGGALGSEYPYGTRPYGPQFVKRDRIQAGLSQAVVLVQTDIKGGSLHATRAALEYGRPVAYPVPTPADISREEPKIQGILRIHQGERSEVARYLECAPSDLSRLYALHSREDYEGLEAALVQSGPPDPEVLSLF